MYFYHYTKDDGASIILQSVIQYPAGLRIRLDAMNQNRDLLKLPSLGGMGGIFHNSQSLQKADHSLNQLNSPITPSKRSCGGVSFRGAVGFSLTLLTKLPGSATLLDATYRPVS